MKTLEEADLILQYKKNTFPREGGGGVDTGFFSREVAGILRL